MGIAIPMLDLMFFLTETVDNPRHVGAVQIFRLPKRGGAARVREIVDAYRRMKPQPPFNRVPVLRTGCRSGAKSSRSTAVITCCTCRCRRPARTSSYQLVADLHAPMLERHRPGWKVYVIEGLAGNRFAMYHKVHHALVDGESGMAIMQRSLSTTARDRRIRVRSVPA